MPALIGISHMPYHRFLTFNAAGGFVWGNAFVCLGNFAGNSYARIEKDVGRDLALAILVLALTGFVVWRVGRSRSRRGRETSSPTGTVDRAPRSVISESGHGLHVPPPATTSPHCSGARHKLGESGGETPVAGPLRRPYLPQRQQSCLLPRRDRRYVAGVTPCFLGPSQATRSNVPTPR